MPRMKKTEVYRVEGRVYPLKVEQTGKDRFTVIYGLQVRRGLTYTQAAHEFGECLFHLLACEGHLDNRRRDEE